MSSFKDKKTVGCILGLVSVLVMYPLAWVYTYFLLSYINAPREIWILYIVNIPVSLTIGVGFKILEIYTNKGDQE